MPAIKARYWLCTVSVAHCPDQPVLTGDLVYLKGQQEIGEGGFHHWQLLAVFGKQVTLNQAKRAIHGTAHLEVCRSAAANDYVWKEQTRVDGTQFELGALPISRARKADWEKVFEDAKSGNFDGIPKDILIRNYSALKRIRVDNCIAPVRDNINVRVYWGESGVGKTRRAWHEAGDDVYIKNPNTKWWDGYRGQKKVIIDEFVGRIDISYILTWCDRYPCMVEVKGFSVPLEATEFWFTSNVNPTDWYMEINQQQRNGLMRRMNTILHMNEAWAPPAEPNPAGQEEERPIDIANELDDILSFLSGEFISQELA